MSSCSRTSGLVLADEDLKVLGISHVPSSTSGSSTGNDGFGLAVPVLVFTLAVGFAVGVGLALLVTRGQPD